MTTSPAPRVGRAFAWRSALVFLVVGLVGVFVVGGPIEAMPVLLAAWALVASMAARLGRQVQARAEQLEEHRDRLTSLASQERSTIARLEESASMQDGFVSAISHELRTPLTVMTGNLRTLLGHRGRLTDAQEVEMLQAAVASADKLDTLLTGILDLNRLTAAGHAHRLEVVDLAAVTVEAMAHLPPHPMDVDLEVAAVVGDPLQLERILANLVGNAVRHAPSNHPIVIRSTRRGRHVELTVADRGPGVPDRLKHAIFEPFHQGETTDPDSPGTGIGLSLVARFAGAHGGRAWVSDRPDGGAVFHVLLPEAVPADLEPVRDLDRTPALQD